MLHKEDLIYQSGQPVLNSRKWLKKLTMILTSVLLLTMFGLGGYWLGARQQQSSSASTIMPSQTDPAYNWKTYEEHGDPFTFQYPARTEIWRLDRNNLTVSYSSPSRLIGSAIVTP